MADNDFNPIRPVENLQNVSGLTPARPRQEGKRRQTPGRSAHPPQEPPRDEAAAEQASQPESSSHTIDYCA